MSKTSTLKLIAGGARAPGTRIPKSRQPYNLDPAFERAVVVLSCCRPRFYGRGPNKLDPELLGNETHRLILDTVRAMVADNGQAPDSCLLVLQRLRRQMREGKVSFEQIEAVLEAMDAAVDAGLPDEEQVLQELAPELRHRIQHAAVMAATHEYAQRGDFSSVTELIEEAQTIGKAPAAIEREQPWPTLDAAANHGIAGQFVDLVAPHSEADPAALLLQFLVAAGNFIGRRAYYTVEGTPHYPNLYLTLVGDSAKARKGTSWGRVRQVFTPISDEWVQGRVRGGLQSGEALIWEVRDSRETINKKTGQEILEPGVDDKRLLVLEEEFGRVLEVIRREGCTLSETLRQAWDSGELRILSKNNPAESTGAHISLIAHITGAELASRLRSVDATNGLGNRFLWALVKRSKLLPHGGDLDPNVLLPLSQRLEQIYVALEAQPLELRMDETARARWEEVYEVLSTPQPGQLAGALTSRAEAQAARLALLYAVLDRASDIGQPHLDAALAVVAYVQASVRHLFGGTTGNQTADAILKELRKSPTGLTRTEVHSLFKRNRPGAVIDEALQLLVRLGLATCDEEHHAGGRGRPAHRWRSVGG